MKKKILAIIVLFIILLHPTVIFAEGFKDVEIFDPKQEKVVKVVKLNPKINNMVTEWIKNVDAIYGKSNPLTDDGYAVRVPLYPSVTVQNKNLNTVVNDVYIIVPKHETPFLMIFDNENRLLCYPFKGDINTLSKVLNFKLETGRSFSFLN
ncbi:hypothetical protein LGK95_07770 [Clostridium algoriphilum]|uniref:hypothetical protein n=1 Tax=Clostridium algoriphilum TaxID=198347 RepID=UPI001CF1FD4F|nr:hypothetical protein [Clostridium algoriphilum]MCB2293418.1 hypothetical protein [Clostridium algoriphilum]